MANVKGTDLVQLRKLVRQLGEEAEKDFVLSLPEDLENLYRKLMPINSGPVDKVSALYELAAKLLFPLSDQPLRALGSAMAEKTYGLIYKFLLRIPSRLAILERAAQIWRSFFDEGDASVENIAEKSSEFVVRKFPSLPKAMREVVAGNLQKLSQLTGRKDVRVEIKDEDASCWRWKMSFD